MAQEQGSAFELENHSAFVELVPQTMAHPAVQQPEHLQQSRFLNPAVAPAGYHRPVAMAPSGLAAADLVAVAPQPSKRRQTIE
jgi:hypothetical protein